MEKKSGLTADTKTQLTASRFARVYRKTGRLFVQDSFESIDRMRVHCSVFRAFATAHQ